VSGVLEWFAEQDASYQQEVLPEHVRARVSAEARIALGGRGSSVTRVSS
jgi:transketolase